MNTFPSEIIFRAICGLLLVMQTASRLWMSFNKPSSDINRIYDGLRETILVRLAGGAVLLAYLYVILPDTSSFDFHIPLFFRWSGSCLMLIGNIIFIAARLALGKQWSAELEIQPDHELIIHGIYQWIRHPMYTGFLLFGFGMILLSANLLGSAYFVIMVVLVSIRLKSEEKMMVEQFGDDYRDYQARSAALFPFIY